MKSNLFQRTLLFAAFLTLPAGLMAQGLGSLRFLFIDESAGEYVLRLETGGYQKLSSAPYTIGGDYKPTSMKPLEILKETDQRDPETGEKIRIPVARVSPPVGMDTALVIITPLRGKKDAEGNPLFDTEIIDSSADKFPAGSIRILNRGLTVMAAKFGKEQITVEAGERQYVYPEPDDRGRIRTRVAIRIPTDDGGLWKLIDNGQEIVKPGRRLTGVLVYSPSGLKFRMSESMLAEHGNPPPAHVWLTYTDTPPETTQ